MMKQGQKLVATNRVGEGDKNGEEMLSTSQVGFTRGLHTPSEGPKWTTGKWKEKQERVINVKKEIRKVQNSLSK